MPDVTPTRRALPARDFVAIIIGMVGTTLLAWTYLLISGSRAGMSAMAMPDMPDMIQLRSWSPADFLLMFAMWAVMMVGMMVPTAIPMTLIYAAVARKARLESTPLPPTAVFVFGYVSMWTLFSAGATFLQYLLERAALLCRVGRRRGNPSTAAAAACRSVRSRQARSSCALIARQPRCG